MVVRGVFVSVAVRKSYTATNPIETSCYTGSSGGKMQFYLLPREGGIIVGKEQLKWRKRQEITKWVVGEVKGR